jgi:sulfur-oxidizing protein SoxY
MLRTTTHDLELSRRTLLRAGGICTFASLVPLRDAYATPEMMADAIREFTTGKTVMPGRVHLDIPPLVENGNTVALTVSVDSPMTEADHVRHIHIFNEKNPQPYVAAFHLGARAGKAQVSTRIRLADSQTVTAIAQVSDGSFWSASADLIVTLAACTEDFIP